MSKFAYNVSLRRLKNNNGVYNGLPRIYNVDRDSYSYGYAEVNVAAASPFVRTKVHDCRLEGNSDVQNGDLIQDRVDSSYYLVMDVKGIFGGGSNGTYAYKDATLYKVSAVATIRRIGDATPDFFGRSTTGFTILASNVKLMVNPQSFGVSEYVEGLNPDNKIKVVLQSKVGVKINDRIETDNGDVLQIENIDKSSLVGLWVCYCDFDKR